jgi:hypothetical protein
MSLPEGPLRMPVLIRDLSRILGLCAAAWLAACSSTGSHYASPAAQACAGQCQERSSQCRARQDSAAQQCEWRRQQAQRDLDNCRANSADATQCTQQVPQCAAAGYAECDTQYRQCDQACGTVTEAAQH